MRIALLITIVSHILEAVSKVIISKQKWSCLDSFVHKRTNLSNVNPEHRTDILSSILSGEKYSHN